MEIRWYIIVFYFGVFAGFLLKAWLVHRSKNKSVGTIYITHNDKKTLYSLELDDYPESIEFKKEVVFKVDSSKQNSDYF